MSSFGSSKYLSVLQELSLSYNKSTKQIQYKYDPMIGDFVPITDLTSKLTNTNTQIDDLYFISSPKTIGSSAKKSMKNRLPDFITNEFLI